MNYTISQALLEATDEQIKSEWARRTQAMRKTKSGGRKGRPKGAKNKPKLCPEPQCCADVA